MSTKDEAIIDVKHALAAPVQPVAHCEAGPDFCQQCHLENNRTLALAAAVRYVKNNTPILVYDEICRAVTTAAQPAVPLTDEQIQKIWDVASGAIPEWSRHIAYARAIEAAHGITKGQP